MRRFWPPGGLQGNRIKYGILRKIIVLKLKN
jgi:hypothetical protein